MWNMTDIFHSLVGGIIIGIAASIFLLGNGRVMGVSGILKGLFLREVGDVVWRFYFFAGIFFGAFILFWLGNLSFQTLNFSINSQIIGGLLVGIGTTLGNGCTSGHGVCGVSRFSYRSIAATITFSTTGILMATIINFLFEGKL